jgi:hypothetical protein
MLVTRVYRIHELHEAWLKLSEGRPFCSPLWMGSWLQQLRGVANPFVLAVKDCDNVVAIAPLHSHTSRIGSERLEFLGTGKACSEYLGILVDPNHLESAVDCLSRWMIEAADGGHGDDNCWERLDMESVSPDDVATNLLCKKLSNRGATWLQRPSASCWRIDLNAGHDQWVAEMHKSIRRKIRNLLTRAVQSGRAKYKIATTISQRLAIYESLVRLHNARRHQLNDVGCFGTPGFYEFLKQIVSDPQAIPFVHLSQLELDGNIVAAGLCLKGVDSLFVYQSGISIPDESNSDLVETNPGWLLNLYHIEYARRSNLRYIDFLRGDERYKRHLGGNANRVDFHMIVPPVASAVIRQQIWTLAQATKNLGKELIAALPQ